MKRLETPISHPPVLGLGLEAPVQVGAPRLDGLVHDAQAI
jgi:hypothetical protein